MGIRSITEQAAKAPAPKLPRHCTVHSVDDDGLWYVVLAEPTDRRGPAIIPEGFDPSVGQDCAVVELDSGVPLLMAVWG